MIPKPNCKSWVSLPGDAAAWRRIVVLLGVLCLAGCDNASIHVYHIPKEDPWKIPAGWKAQEPDGMRAAQFLAPSTGGSDIDVSVIPLPPQFGGSEVDVLNIWRQQLKLTPLADGDAASTRKVKVTIGNVDGDLHDMTSEEKLVDNKAKTRTLVAVTRRDGQMWFIKMTGDEDGVEKQKPVFLSFLKSVNFNNIVPPAARMPSRRGDRDPHTAGDDRGAAHDYASHPEWEVPAGWAEQPPGQFLNAKFIVAGDGGARADVNVSTSPGDGGGVLPNVNRWRNQQLGLEVWDEAALEKNATSVEAVGTKALLVEFEGKEARSGDPARLVAAIVRLDGSTWFYKMMGNPSVVQREKDAFLKFVRTAKHPNTKPNG